MKTRTIFLLLFITLVAAFLRFYRLGDIPVGFHRDEAFLGYNAYSLLKTGNDMTGHPFPLHFESFLYSPAGYSYFSIPFIAAFDLSPFSARAASAFFGTATIILTFFFVTVLFREEKRKNILGLLTSLALAITPWHINLSRTATENTIVVFFVTLGATCYFLALQKKQLRFLILSILSLASTLTVYQGTRAFIPLMVVVLFLMYRTKPVISKTSVVGVILVVFSIALPIVMILKTPKLATRISTVSIFSTEQTKLLTEETIREDGVMNITPIVARIIDNKLINYTQVFLNNFFAHTSFAFLFTDIGFPDRYRVPGAGLLYISFLPLLLYGFIKLANKYPKHALFLCAWVGVAIVGSALTFDDVPNLQRTVIVFPALSVFIGYGSVELLERIRKEKLLLLGSILLICFLSFEIVRYLHHYYIIQVAHRPWYRQEGYKQLVSSVNELLPNYEKAIITDSQSAPAIFFLFFNKYDPEAYITETRNSKLRDFNRVDFADYVFSLDECPVIENEDIDLVTLRPTFTCYVEPNTLYVSAGTCRKPKVCATVLKDIKRSDGTTVFTLLEMSPASATASVKMKKVNQ